MLLITLFSLFHLAWTATNDTDDVVFDPTLGPYPVAIYEHEIKTSRPDPLSTTPGELRRLLITIYKPFLDTFNCPTEYQQKIPYGPQIVYDSILYSLLPNTSFPEVAADADKIRLINCTLPISSSPQSSAPVLIFSHGYGGSHVGYASILQSTASSGYTVVAVDHTYEAAAVVFPDGTVAQPTSIEIEDDETLEGIYLLQDIRINDTVSVLDAIETGQVPGLGCYSPSCQNNLTTSTNTTTTTLRAITFGHSFGGSTAANVAALDSRVLGGINIDGLVYPPLQNSTTTKPILIIQSSALPPTVPNMTDFYVNNAKGWKTWVKPEGTVHYGFTDVPLLADLFGVRNGTIPLELTGSIGSRRLQEIIWRYTTAFFGFVIDGKGRDLLEGSVGEFPDVEFVGHDDGK